MIFKALELVRKFKKDNADKEFNFVELETLASQFDEKNDIEWQKLNMKKDRADLDNEKLKIEIIKLKEDRLVKISDDITLNLNDIKYMQNTGNGAFSYAIVFKNQEFIYVNELDYNKINKLINQ